MSPASATLTFQQRRVLHLLAAGLSTKQIAARLHVSTRTAQWHVSALMRALDAPNRAAVVTIATRRHLLRHTPVLRRSVE